MTNNKNTLDLFRWIRDRCRAILICDRLDVSILNNIKPNIVVSYNYDYIVSRECIEAIDGNIINMHILLLPWNRGFSPNIWSFIDNTPKGVTIHKLSERLDSGDLLYQKEMNFDVSTETFETSYMKLNNAIVALFKEHWDEIYSGDYNNSSRAQTHTGSYHDMRDLYELQKKLPFDWGENIKDFLARYERCCTN